MLLKYLTIAEQIAKIVIRGGADDADAGGPGELTGRSFSLRSRSRRFRCAQIVYRPGSCRQQKLSVSYFLV
jgi:hypothetical protein